jgi:hypothetical protein
MHNHSEQQELLTFLCYFNQLFHLHMLPFYILFVSKLLCKCPNYTAQNDMIIVKDKLELT